MLQGITYNCMECLRKLNMEVAARELSKAVTPLFVKDEQYEHYMRKMKASFAYSAKVLKSSSSSSSSSSSFLASAASNGGEDEDSEEEEHEAGGSSGGGKGASAKSKRTSSAGLAKKGEKKRTLAQRDDEEQEETRGGKGGKEDEDEDDDDEEEDEFGLLPASKSSKKGAKKSQSTESSSISVKINNLSRNLKGPVSASSHNSGFVEVAFELSQVAGAAATRLFASPHDINAANVLVHELLQACHERTGPNSNAVEVLLPVQRLYSKEPNSLVSCLLSAHECASRRRYAECMQRYLNAFVMDSQQPLTALCLSAQLVFFANHSLVPQKTETLMKAFAFLNHYRSARKQQQVLSSDSPLLALTPQAAEAAAAVAAAEEEEEEEEEKAEEQPGEGGGVRKRQKSSAAAAAAALRAAAPAECLSALGLEQETLYNMGRAFHEVKLFHLAAENYQRALDLAENNPVFAASHLNLTKEAAHNLVLIYKRSEAHDLALEVMRKHLSL